MTIVAHAKMVGHSLEAAAILQRDHDINVEVINLRTIRPLDRPCIIESIKKTNRIVSVEEGWPQHGIGAEIAASIMESDAFDYLDAPMERVCGAGNLVHQKAATSKTDHGRQYAHCNTSENSIIL